MDETKLKAFTDNKLNNYNICVFDRVENIVEKGENAGYQHFLLFPQCFQQACFPGASKGVIVWEQVNPFPNKPCFFLFSPGLHYKSFENTVGKGEIARNEPFLLFPQCFLSVSRILCHFLSN